MSENRTVINLTNITENSSMSDINLNFRKLQTEISAFSHHIEPTVREAREFKNYMDTFLMGEPPISERKAYEYTEDFTVDYAQKKIYSKNTPPENPEVGDLWLDCSPSPPTFLRWNGEKWEKLSATTFEELEGMIDYDQLPDHTIDSMKIAIEGIKDINLSEGAVTADKILDEAITNAKLAADAVSAINIQNNAVDNEKLADLSVTAEKLADGSVEFDKISDLAKEAINTVAKEYTDEEITSTRNEIASELANKAEQAFVEAQLENKANREEVENSISTILNDLSEKVDAEWVDGKLQTKANVSDVYTIEDIDGMFDNVVSVTDYSTDMSGVIDSITDHETRISQTESDIVSKVEQSVFNQLEDEVGNIGSELESVSTTVEQNAERIESKASQTYVNELAGEVSSLESSITQQADLIEQRVTKTEYESDIDDIRENFSNHESRITQTEKDITSKVEKSVFDSVTGDLDSRVTTVSQTAEGISQEVGAISTNLEDLSDVVSSHTTAIEQNEEAITQRATRSEVDSLAGRVSTAEGSISTLAGEVSLKASQTDVNNLEDRMSTAESSLRVLPEEIEAKVDKDGIIAAFNLSPESEKLEAQRIDLDGDVNIVNGRTRIKEAAIGSAAIQDLAVKNQHVESIHANKITAGTIAAERIAIGPLTQFADGFDPTTKETPSGAQSKANTAESNAKSHAETKASQAESSAKSHANTVANNALNDAKAYRDLWAYKDTTYIDGGNIYANSITANQIASNAITANKIDSKAVTAEKLAANAVSADAIASNAILTKHIASGAVTANEISSNAITADAIASGAILTKHISAEGIDASVLKAGSVIANNIKFSGSLEGASGTFTGVLNTESNINVGSQITMGYDSQSGTRILFEGYDPKHEYASIERNTGGNLVIHNTEGRLDLIGVGQGVSANSLTVEENMYVRGDVRLKNGAVIHVTGNGDYSAIYADGVGASGNGGIIYFFRPNTSHWLSGAVVLHGDGKRLLIGQNGKIHITAKAEVDDHLYLNSGEIVSNTGWLRCMEAYTRTYTSDSQHARVTSTGIIGRITSSRRYKLLEEEVDLNYAKRILQLNPKTWYDKRAVEDYAHTLHTGEETECQRIERIGGIIAEDTHEAGLGLFVEYDELNRPDSVHDTIIYLLIPLVNDLYKRIDKLEEKLNGNE